MSIAFVQSASARAAASTSVTATLGVAATANDLLVGFCISPSAFTVTVPSGWTALNPSATNSIGIRGAYKIAAGGETTAAWSVTSSTNMVAAIAEYSSGTNPVVFVAQAVTSGIFSATGTTPAVTPNAGKAIVLVFGIGETNALTFSGEAVNSATSGVTERRDTGGSGAGPSLSLSDFFVTSAVGSYSATAAATAAGQTAAGCIVVFETPTTAQSISATVTTTATITKQIGKLITFNPVSTTASIVKSVGKLITFTSVTTTASITKQVGKTVSATATTTASIVKSVGKTLSGSVTTTASIVKQVGKILSATVTSTASIVTRTAVTYAVAMTATVTVTATLTARRVMVFLAETFRSLTFTRSSSDSGTITPSTTDSGTMIEE